MNKYTLAAILMCAAALTGCGNDNAKNESSLVIEVQSGTTVASSTAAASESVTSTTVSTTASLVSSSTTSSTAVSATTDAAQTTVSTITTSQTTVSETTTTTTTTTIQTTTQTAIQTTTTVNPSKNLVLFKDLNVGGDCTTYVKQHSGYKFDEAVSCHGEGKDRVYNYDTYIINSFFNGKTDTVYEIIVLGEGITVEDKLSIGMKKADVIAAIGEGDEDVYHRRSYDLSILYDENDLVSTISLLQLED